ncbi:hypothetical protein Tco_0893632 [Tanacetum coccineum]|uniref:Uncharacterized protein n=1 Tax=Tanacetum coccineum TaxID=301880 RepID=A0ABQ5C9C9_9ASTR
MSISTPISSQRIDEDQFEGFSDSNDDSTSIDDDSFSIDDIDYVEASPPDSELVSLEEANEVLVTKGALKSEVGHLDMIEHEVGRLCDDYAWWKLTRRCWNTHVLSTADMNQKERMWLEFWPRNGMVVLVSFLRKRGAFHRGA